MPTKLWEKGKSGNPLGRPKDTIGVIIRDKTKNGQEIIERVLGLFRTSNDEDIVMKAALFLTDRGWGKAPQPLEHSGEAVSRMVLVFPEDEKK